MANEFRRQFYGKNFKGGASTLYVGDRFWNVKMDGLSDSCVFTHGWSELVNDLVLDSRSNFVFSMVGYKTFEVSVFNHQTGTEIQFKKVDLVKMSTVETDVEQGFVGDYEDDNIQLSTFESIFNDIDDSKFDKFFSSLVEMEDIKKKFKDDLNKKTDPKGKAKVVGDESLSSKVKSMFEMDLDNFLIPKNKFHVYTVDPRGKSNVFACDRSLSSKVVSDVKRMPFVGDTLKSSPKVDVDKFVVLKKKKEGNL
ncbi:putative transcription factor B3-Domain family [Helianthus annuus]|nr:putative transcription factor B3-Domain family [Helianthus annuus]